MNFEDSFGNEMSDNSDNSEDNESESDSDNEIDSDNDSESDSDSDCEDFIVPPFCDFLIPLLHRTMYYSYNDNTLYKTIYIHLYEYLKDNDPNIEKPSRYEMIYNLINNFIIECAESFEKELLNCDDLQIYFEKWNQFWKGILRISVNFKLIIFNFINPFWTNINEIEFSHNIIYSFEIIAINAWKKYVLNQLNIKIEQLILNEIDQVRLNTNSDINTLKLAIENMLLIQKYENEMDSKNEMIPVKYKNKLQLQQQLINTRDTSIEKKIIANAKIFYITKAQLFLLNHTYHDYINTLQIWFFEEKKRSENIYSFTTLWQKKLQDEMYSVLIVPYMPYLLKEFKKYLKQSLFHELKQLYSILMLDRETETETIIQSIGTVFEKFYFQQSQKLLKNESDFNSLLLSIINFKQSVISTIHQNFDSNNYLLSIFTKVMRSLINNPLLKSSYNAAKYSDYLLKKENNLSEFEREEKLNIVIQFIKYLENKDEFLEFYIYFLSKRFIQFTNYDNDNRFEIIMFQQLKELFGLELTYRLKLMLEDIKISADLCDQFKNNNNNNNSLKCEYNPLILTNFIWSLKNGLNPVVKLMPQELQNVNETFLSFYLTKFPKKKLNFFYEESRFVLDYTSNQNNYKLLCSFHQYLILNQFTKSKGSNFIIKKDLPVLTGLSESIIQNVLDSFVKLKLIGPNKDYTKYALNPNFKHDSLNINCIAILMSIILSTKSQEKNEEEEKKVQKETQQKIRESRLLQVYACITRIMKKHKQLDSQQLKNEVFSQLFEFNPTTDLFNQAINYCINKEYIEITTDKSLNTSIVYRYIEEIKY